MKKGTVFEYETISGEVNRVAANNEPYAKKIQIDLERMKNELKNIKSWKIVKV